MTALWTLLTLVLLVAIPAWLLLVGHRLRDRGLRARGAFWGGVAGHVTGDLLCLTVLLWPPLAWPPSPGVWIVPATLLVPLLAGTAVGAAVGRPPRRKRTR